MATEGMSETPGAGAATEARPDFPAFYRDVFPDVARALAITLADPPLGEEAADEAMVRAAARWTAVQRSSNGRGWAFKEGLDWARSKRRRTLRAPRFRVSGGITQPEVTDTALHAAMRSLDIDERAVIVGRYLFDWSLTEIADVLGIREDAVENRLQRALARLDGAMPPGQIEAAEGR